MLMILRWALMPAVLAGSLLTVSPVAAATPGVKDDGSFFSPDAVQKANDQIRTIKDRFHKDLVIETYAEIPAAKKAQFDPKMKGQFFGDWMRERAKAEKVDGIFVLICKEPGRVEVGVGAETQKREFTMTNRDALAKIFLDNFAQKKFDDGLLDGVRYVAQTVEQNLKGAAPAATAPKLINDRASFFSDTAVNQANNLIRDIKREYSKDVMIETFPEIPEDRQEAFKRESPAKFYSDWVRDRARAEQLNGIYVLICKKPGHVEVAVGEETQRKAFTLQNRNELSRILLDNFKKDKHDEGLLAGLGYVQKTIGHNLRAESGPPARHGGGDAGHGMNWMGILCPLIVVVGLVWLFIGLIRAFTGGGGGGGMGGGYGGGGGGGGFMTGLFGGLFGAMAGNWLYHNFLGGGGSSAYGGDTSSGGGAGAGGSDQGEGFSSTGGDFDGGGGGGGGDFGGGGGDFGGGGGDFGGGGGDFGGGGGGDF